MAERRGTSTNVNEPEKDGRSFNVKIYIVL